jgi:chromosome segregation protein
MRLKRVRLFGFKTFADRTEFSLEGGIVAVVGPNGCGKSNLVDAILWGLGEGNARALRAQTGQDVIFSGSPGRKPVGFAEVTLLFDNEDGALPIDTPEVSITRRLTRAGDSEYSINKRTCRLRDIYDLLADSGLGRAGYAIVGQKEIDAALSASAEDRRAWVDEAAGVQRYRARKIESKRRLAQASEHLERVNDILRELESQREPLREEAEEAIRYKSLMGALRGVEISLLLDEIARTNEEFAECERRLAEASRLSREEVERAGRLEHQSRAVGHQISELETELDAIRARRQELLTHAERAESDRRVLEQRLRDLDEQERRLDEDAESSSSRIREAEAERDEAAKAASEAVAALDALRLELAGVGEEAKALANALREREAELEAARRRHARRLKAEAERAQRTERLKLVQRELQGIEDGLPDLEAAIGEAKAALDEVVGKGQATERSTDDLEARIAGLRREEERKAAEVRKLMAERATLEGRRRGIEATLEAHEGLTQGARAVMEAAARGLLGARYTPVGEAVEAEPDVALAIETALGGSINDLICDDPQDAKEAIGWLKADRAGRATFQPIPLMRASERSYELRKLKGERGVVGVASDLVECASRVRPVIESLLGRVVIVETIDDALRLARTSGWSRLVTLEGEVVHSGGAVTGGQSRHQGYGLVQRRAELLSLEDELARIATQVRDGEARAAAFARDRAKAETELAEQRAASKQEGKEVQEARGFLQTLENERKAALREREKLQRERSELEGGEEVEGPVDVGEYEARRDEALRAVAGKSADAEGAERRLREAEERVRETEGRRIAGERRLHNANEAERLRIRRADHLEPERARLRGEIAEAETRIATHRRDGETTEAVLREATVRRVTLLEESLRLSEEAKEARTNATAVADAAHQAEVGRTRADARRTAALARLMDEYGLSQEDAIALPDHEPIPDDAQAIVNRMRRELRAMGDVNLGAIEAYERLTTRFEELAAQTADIESGIAQIESAIRELDKMTRDRFLDTLRKLEVEFAEAFQKLFGGGEGKIALSEPDDVLESGIDLLITLPGKRRQPLPLLSGGERSLCAMAFLFALLRVKPSPLVVLDEVDAPLDGRNVERFVQTLQELTDKTQFIVITHNHTTMVSAPVLLGVSMQAGVSMLLPARLPEEAAADEAPIVPAS